MPENQYKTKTINVRFSSRMTPDEYREVDAYLVGGTEGVFAAWKEGNIVHLAAGDDGGWWEIAGYHEHWIEGMLACLQLAKDQKQTKHCK